jgi:hypothetical protein
MRRKPFVNASTTPCIHCGSPYNSFTCHGGALRDGSPIGLVFQVVCLRCRAMGPLCKTAEEALTGWAYRALPQLGELEPEDDMGIEFEDVG